MIELNQVTKSFQGKEGPVHALKDIQLSINKGEAFGVIGESGAGKSTLLRLINALELPDQGDIKVDGQIVNQLKKRGLRAYRKEIGMIFQHFNLLHNQTVKENILLPLHLHRYENPLPIDDVLRFVGLEDKKNSYPSELSGGQKQRVGIARALISRPQILLCDEPTSALDQNTTEGIVDVLKRAHKEFNMTIIIVTHELPVVKALCERSAIMEAGRIVDVVSVNSSETKKEFKPYHERAIEVLTHE